MDANESIATGHLMRCIAIAVECRKQGAKCIFFLAEDKETVRLSRRGFSYRVLNTKWNQMDGEIPDMQQLIKEEQLNVLVVDSYQVTLRYLSCLQQKVPVLYVDDFGKTVYPVDMVLHYIPASGDDGYAKMYQGTKTCLLQGMQYAPLRQEFAEDDIQVERKKSILITTGGTDSYNVTGKLLAYCEEQPEFVPYTFDVIVGTMNRNEVYLQDMAQKNPRIQLHKNVTNMSDYMRRCEMAVSAGGTTLLELCACRIPTVCFSFADNQVDFAKLMQRQNIMLYAGDARIDDRIEQKIAEQLCLFMQNDKMRTVYADRMGKLVDGKGTARITECLMEN